MLIKARQSRKVALVAGEFYAMQVCYECMAKDATPSAGWLLWPFELAAHTQHDEKKVFGEVQGHREVENEGIITLIIHIKHQIELKKVHSDLFLRKILQILMIDLSFSYLIIRMFTSSNSDVQILPTI